MYSVKLFSCNECQTQNPHFAKMGFKVGIKMGIPNNRYFEEYGILVLGIKWGYRIPIFSNSNSDCVDPNNGLDFFWNSKC